MTSAPHDALFKAVFQQLDHAEAELRHVLPEHLVETLDWSSLVLEPGSFVDPELQHRHSDLLFSVRAGRERILVYLLFEHQSSNHPRMPLKLLEYMVRAWTRYAQENPKGPLPVIVPVVLAHAPGGWTSPPRFRALFDPRASSLLPWVPDFTYLVDDISGATDAELRRRTHPHQAKLALWLMRDIRDADALLSHLAQWADLLEALAHSPDGPEALRLLLYYVARGATDLQFSAFRATLQQRAPLTDSIAMSTIAEQLHAEGRLEGRLEGKVEGEAAATARSILRVMRARGLTVSEGARRRLEACTDLPTLERWLDRALVETSAEDVFAE